MARKGKRRCDQLPVLHADAAGIDIGASELFVAVPAGRDADPVRSFCNFHAGSQRASRLASALWSSICGDGINERLLDPGAPDPGVSRVEVYLVNAHHVKNIPGRKTDVSDCQW